VHQKTPRGHPTGKGRGSRASCSYSPSFRTSLTWRWSASCQGPSPMAPARLSPTWSELGEDLARVAQAARQAEDERARQGGCPRVYQGCQVCQGL